MSKMRFVETWEHDEHFKAEMVLDFGESAVVAINKMKRSLTAYSRAEVVRIALALLWESIKYMDNTNNSITIRLRKGDKVEETTLILGGK